MNIKREAYNQIVVKLENELKTVKSKISTNKYRFKVLAQEQATLKRERGILTKLISDVKRKEKTYTEEGK